MNIDFALVLVCLVAATGLLALIDILFVAPKRKKIMGDKFKSPLIFEYARSFFPILLIVLFLRSFVVEPFRIPSGSLEPTLLVGDFVLVNKFDYGLRWPVINKKFVKLGEPHTGDVVVFRWPPNPKLDYIKRFIGKPGDHIKYINKVLYVNGKKAIQTFDSYTTDTDGNGHVWKVKKILENLNGVKHFIFTRPNIPARDFDVVVPAGHYFAMGDNRDDSSDSRFWGAVPEKNLIGKAFVIWLSWDSLTTSLRWDRIGQRIL